MKKIMRKQFVIAGSNGHFYGKSDSLTAFKKRMKEIKHSLEVYGCGDYDEKRKPKELYVYEIVNSFTVDVSNIKLLK